MDRGSGPGAAGSDGSDRERRVVGRGARRRLHSGRFRAAGDRGQRGGRGIRLRRAHSEPAEGARRARALESGADGGPLRGGNSTGTDEAQRPESADRAKRARDRPAVQRCRRERGLESRSLISTAKRKEEKRRKCSEDRSKWTMPCFKWGNGETVRNRTRWTSFWRIRRRKRNERRPGRRIRKERR